MVDVRPKKHLGQHFLTEPGISQRIAAALSGTPDRVLEIGPGKGILTRALLGRGDVEVRVIEIDGESVSYLKENIPQLRDRIIEGDFLKTNLADVFAGSYCIAGNFPYNISSQILFRIYNEYRRIPEVVGMFQKEVARRIASGPGTKEYGILSVLLQTWYNIEYLFTVEPGSFFPPPKVQSGVLRLRRNGRQDLGVSMQLYTNIVKAGFNQRRKKLRNALSAYRFPEDTSLDELLGLRAEQLGVEEWIRLAGMVLP